MFLTIIILFGPIIYLDLNEGNVAHHMYSRLFSAAKQSGAIYIPIPKVSKFFS